MDYTEIYLIRHGETTWNIERRWQGHKNSPLSENGVAQATALGERLTDVEFSTFYASDLARAYETAQHVAAPHNMDVLTDERLRERNGGVVEGLTMSELAEKHPEVHKELHGKWLPTYAPPGGENLIELQKRGVAALTDLAQRHIGSRIAVVSHGATMRAILQHVMNIPLENSFRMSIANTSLHVIRYGEFRDGPWLAVTLGDIAHTQQTTTNSSKGNVE